MAVLSSEEYFGLDIGTTGIRAVQMRGTAGNPALVSYASAPLPAGLTVSDSPIDHEKISGAIRDLVKQAKFSTNNVVAGIPSAQAFATVITTPKLSSAELEKAIKLQADQFIPMAIDQVRMDWQVVGERGDSEMDVLIVAAPNSLVTKYLKIVEGAGLQLAALEMNAVALIRSLMPQDEVAVLILDIGSMYSDIVIVKSKAPQLVRSVNIGGNTLVRAAAQALALDESQSEQFVRKFGLTQTKLDGQVLKALKPSLDMLLGEIDKSIKFFATKAPDTKLEKIILTGGTAAMPELPVYLANATGLPVSMANPWIHVSYPANLQEELNSLALEYPVAIGLAERSFV